VNFPQRRQPNPAAPAMFLCLISPVNR
jgi:hypothetical protein